MFRKFALFCVFLTFCVIVLGAYVRATGSGLGCPDWPGCYGQMIVQAVPADASGSLSTDVAKAWKAMAHRYLAGALGVSALILFLCAFWVKERRLATVAWSTLSLSLVGLQAALGMWAVELLVMPVVVTAHLLAGLLTLGAFYLVYLTQRPDASAKYRVGGALRWLARLSLPALLLQILLGGWVSVNHAALSCPDFPTCLGTFDPQADYMQGFSFSLESGVSGQIVGQDIAARIAVHWAHRLGAAVSFALLTVLALSLSSNPRTARLSKTGLSLSFLLMTQIGLGAAVVLLRLPVVLVAAHAGVGALLLLNLLHIVYFLRAPVPVSWEEEKKPTKGELREMAEATTVVLGPKEAAAPETALAREEPRLPPEGLFGRLKSGLGKTRTGLSVLLANIALGKKAIDRNLLDDIEAQLLMADIGISSVNEIVADLTESLERHQLDDAQTLTARLRERLQAIIEPVSRPLVIDGTHKPFVILVVGVNGVGKTTTIGKLARRLKNQGRSVMLAAGDTFRAAAVEQLQTWGDRNDIHVVAQHTGADSASVIYDGVQAAQARGIDVLIADTAGRLHTKSNLMEELAKIKRIMGKLDPTAPHEVLLVLDACTGQNAINQCKQFNEAVGLTGLAVTKLDGTAKGGVVFALAKQFGIPIRYVGVGESIDDLQDFDAGKFVEALFAD